MQEWFAEHEEEVGHLDWPPQSPDLNIIEHLWGYLESKLRARFPPPSTISALETALHEEWLHIPLQVFHDLYASIPRRIQKMSEVIPVENRMVQFLTRTLQNSRAMSEVIPAENGMMQMLTRTLSNRNPFGTNIYSSTCKPFKGQVYEDLKHQAQESGQLFEDSEFPAADSSLFYSGNSQLPGPVQWKRPKYRPISQDQKMLPNAVIISA
ncbi:calpain-5 [Trichonephila clavipes]|nr:calpain-5 [Trichonephila clavipes]